MLCSGLKRAGQENVVYNLACGLKANSYDVSVVSLYGGGYSALLQKAGIATLIVEDELKHKSLKNTIVNRILTLSRILRGTNSRAVLIHGLGFERMWPLVNVLVHKMVTVFVFHNNYQFFERKCSMRLFVFRIFLRYMNKLVFINPEMMKRALHQIRIKNESRLHVIPNGINPSSNEVDRGSFLRNIGIETNRNILIQVGRFVPQKNQIDSIYAFIENESLRRDCHLILLGDGELYESCKRWSK